MPGIGVPKPPKIKPGMTLEKIQNQAVMERRGLVRKGGKWVPKIKTTRKKETPKRPRPPRP